MTDGEIAFLSMTLFALFSFIIVIGYLSMSEKKREE